MARRVSHAPLHARMTPSSLLYLFPLNNSVSRFYSLHFSRSQPHGNATAAAEATAVDDDDDLMTQYDFNLMHSPKRRKGKREEKMLPCPSALPRNGIMCISNRDSIEVADQGREVMHTDSDSRRTEPCLSADSNTTPARSLARTRTHTRYTD